MINDPFYTIVLPNTFHERKCLVFVIVCNQQLSGRTSCRSGPMAVHRTTYIVILCNLAQPSRAVTPHHPHVVFAQYLNCIIFISCVCVPFLCAFVTCFYTYLLTYNDSTVFLPSCANYGFITHAMIWYAQWDIYAVAKMCLSVRLSCFNIVSRWQSI